MICGCFMVVGCLCFLVSDFWVESDVFGLSEGRFKIARSRFIVYLSCESCMLFGGSFALMRCNACFFLLFWLVGCVFGLSLFCSVDCSTQRLSACWKNPYFLDIV